MEDIALLIRRQTVRLAIEFENIAFDPVGDRPDGFAIIATEQDPGRDRPGQVILILFDVSEPGADIDEPDLQAIVEGDVKQIISRGFGYFDIHTFLTNDYIAPVGAYAIKSYPRANEFPFELSSLSLFLFASSRTSFKKAD